MPKYGESRMDQIFFKTVGCIFLDPSFLGSEVIIWGP